MPPPRFRHGYVHDVFLSYTRTDDEPDAGFRWVTKFMEDLETRLPIVSGHSVDVWRDKEKLLAADRFDDSIKMAIDRSAVLLVVLSPSYFNSDPCRDERKAFDDKIVREGRVTLGTRARVVKVAKFFVPLDKYPEDLRRLNEHRFYVEENGRHKELHLSTSADVRGTYASKVDDVAQEIATLLSALDTTADASRVDAPVAGRSIVYLGQGTSDVEPQRDLLRRQLIQLGLDVEPSRELRLLPDAEVRATIADGLSKARLAVFPVGGFYGFVPEGAQGKSLVEIQLELAMADRRNGDLPRIIWVPEDVRVQEEKQQAFLDQIRTAFAGRGFELLERPYRTLEALVTARLRSPVRINGGDGPAPDSVYLVCDNADRALAKTLRSFMFNQRLSIEWTPSGVDDLSTSEEHKKLLRRNRTHVVLHGETSEGWLQDRIRELNDMRQGGIRFQAIYLAHPVRDDKDEILVRDIAVLKGYPPASVGSTLESFLHSARAES